MAICAECGEANPDRARFCLACGSPLVAADASTRRTRRTVTVLFCDLSGSTALGERLDPEAMRSLMEGYYELARATVGRHGGMVEKFIGDAVMAVFGATEAHEDDALRAVRAAVELRDGLALPDSPGGDGQPTPLAVRIGIATGEVIVGDPAAGEAFATGDAVNVAARLEQGAAPGEVLLSEATLRLVVDAVASEPLGERELRGKSAPVRVHRLLQVAPDVPGRTRRLDLPLVGRRRERQLLAEAFERTLSDGVPNLFTVLGAAGVGKSRLVHEFVADARLRARVLRGRCLPYGDGITYWPIAEIVREAAQIRASDRQGTALERLSALLAGEGPERILVRDLLAGAIGLGTAGGTPEETAWAVRQLLAELARERPLVVVVDDIHWAAPALLDLLEGLLDWIRDVPLLLVCQARPELLEIRPTWSGGRLNATSILLEPLNEEECGILTAELLAGGTVPAEIVGRVGAASEGNPLFLEEFVAMLIDEGRLRREGDRWVVVGSLAELEVPPSVSALLAARLDRLDPGERRVLEVASVQGKTFSRAAIEAIEPADRSRVGPQLAALVRQELIRPETGGATSAESYRFRHILLRDAAYVHLPKAERGALHERFAGWLTDVSGDRLDEFEEIVGYHWEQAWRYRLELRPDDPGLAALAASAAGHLGAAGRRAQARGDLRAAVALLARAIAVAPLPTELLVRLQVDLGASQGDLGQFEPALATLSRALEQAETGGADVAAALARVELARLGLNSTPVGWAAAATETAMTALRTFEAAGDDRGQARAWNLIGMVDVMRTRAQGMLEAHDRARAFALRAGDARLASDSAIWVAISLFMGPTPAAEGLHRCDEMLAAPDLHARTEAGIRASRAGLLSMVGDVSGCRADIARVRELTALLGPSVLGAAYTQLYGMAEVLSGDAQAAAAYLREGLELLERMGEVGFRSTSAGLLGYVLFDTGDAAGAAEYSLRCRELAAPDDVFSQMMWRLGLARPWALQGRMVEALALLEEAVAIARSSDFPWVQGSAIMNQGSLLVLAGQREAGEAAIREAIGLYELKGVAPSIATARAQMAALAAREA